MSGISTHVLDTTLGRPALGVEVTLERQLHAAADESWQPCAHARTDADGRIKPLLTPESMRAGVYRITFATGSYFGMRGLATLYPEITITFSVLDAEQAYHIPLLLNPFGYTTYRGS